MKKRTYRESIEQAWELLGAIGKEGKVEVVFLGRTYSVDFDKRKVIDLSNPGPVKDYYEILILHYLAKEKSVTVSDPIEWVGFQDLPSGKFYYSAFRQRTIGRLDGGFPDDPAPLWENGKKIGGEDLKLGDSGFQVRAFPKAFVAVLYWRGDGEVSSRYDILFNREVARLYSTEDTVVLAQTVVGVLATKTQRHEGKN